MGTSAIEWTDKTWNVVTGCTEVSKGCDHCYARVLSHGRLKKIYGARRPAVDTPDNRADTFAVRLWPERLRYPLTWKKPCMIFVNSMSDFFHVDIPEADQRKQIEVMLQADWHIYQILTKRPGRAIKFFERNPNFLTDGRLPSHLWVGVSIENQETVYRVEQLRSIPARMRWLSCEPLLGPIRLDLSGIHWVVVGGESGDDFRRMEPAWARSIRDHCLAADVPFFFKQWGGRTAKSGGRMLDRRLWNEYPPREL